MGAALSNRNFVSIASSSLIFGIAVGIAGGLGVYFYTYVFELGSNALLILGLSIIPAALIGVVLAPVIGRAMDKKRACLTVFFLAIASTTIPLGAWLLGLMPAGAPWVLPVIIIDNMATTGLATTGFIIVSSMIADVVDESAVKTGERSEGLLYAAGSLVRKVTSSFAAPAARPRHRARSFPAARKARARRPGDPAQPDPDLSAGPTPSSRSARPAR